MGIRKVGFWVVSIWMFCFQVLVVLHSFANEKMDETDVLNYEGITFTDIKRAESTYRIIEIDLQKVDFSLHRNKIDGNLYEDFKELEDELLKLNRILLFSANAGIFHRDYTPNGLYIENGKVLYPLNTQNGKGNFYLKPNGVFMIQGGKPTIMETTRYKSLRAIPDFALQSGPLLLDKGKLHQAFNKGSSNKFTRSGIGIKDDHTVVLALSNTPVNLYAFADLFRSSLYCSSALYLDGFISQFYVPGKSKEINLRPYGSYIAVNAK